MTAHSFDPQECTPSSESPMPQMLADGAATMRANEEHDINDSAMDLLPLTHVRRSGQCRGNLENIHVHVQCLP